MLGQQVLPVGLEYTQDGSLEVLALVTMCGDRRKSLTMT